MKIAPPLSTALLFLKIQFCTIVSEELMTNPPPILLDPPPLAFPSSIENPSKIVFELLLWDVTTLKLFPDKLPVLFISPLKIVSLSCQFLSDSDVSTPVKPP